MMNADDTERVSPDDALLRALWQEARDLIKFLEGTAVQRFAVQGGDYKIEIERNLPGAVMVSNGSAPMVVSAAVPQIAPGAADLRPQAGEAPDTRIPIVAPLVGTFYRSSQPGATPFVQVGDTVDKDQTVAIVEAMKILNQVKADRAGRVSEVLVQDGEWVEFQQVLIYLDPPEE